MSLILSFNPAVKDKIQGRLLIFAGFVLFFYSLALTLAPAVRVHSWQVEYRWAHWIGFLVWALGFGLVHWLTMNRLPERDPYLLPSAGILSGLGVLTIWRLDPNFGLRQTIWLGLCLMVLGLIVTQPRLLVYLRRYKYLWLTSGLLLTAVALFFGTYPGDLSGPNLWLGCCGIYLQPSEFLKLLLVIYLAAYLSDRPLVKIGLVPLLLPTLILGGTALVLLIAQKDLGTATLFITLYALLAYIGSGQRRLLVISGALILLAAVAGYQLFGIIQVRINAWLNPWPDSTGNSYQIVQSLIAVASGGIFGTGPGLGSPSVVPVALSDFIFPAIVEEIGLTGGIGILIVWIFLGFRGFVASLRAPNRFQRFLTAGITISLLIQAIWIIGGNIRLLPLTGVTLPFMSYGGSSLLASFIGIGLLLLVSSHSEDEIAPLTNSQPYRVTGGFLLVGFSLIAILVGYWGLIRNEELVARADNPRWTISDRFVQRGKIVDRNNQLITISSGVPGNLQRTILYPTIGSVIGYSHPLYGQTGLEKILDPYLRGLQGVPSSSLNYYHIFFSQTPPGLDVRLTLDLDLQKKADDLLVGRSAALVLMNAQTGEIFAMSSHPGIDPNRLDDNWSVYSASKQAVFINRATQGQYPPGAALGPFLLAAVDNQGNLPAVPVSSSINFKGVKWDCAIPISAPFSWESLISHGCPGGLQTLGKQIPPDQIIQLLTQLQLDKTPSIEMPVVNANPIQSSDEPDLLALGESKLLVSPLQMALAACALSMDGVIPAPRILSAVNTPLQGWTIIPSTKNQPGQAMIGRNSSAARLQTTDLPIWSVTANAQTNEGKITWHLTGTLPSWKGTPVALALVLENDDPAGAYKIGTELMNLLLFP